MVKKQIKYLLNLNFLGFIVLIGFLVLFFITIFVNPYNFNDIKYVDDYVDNNNSKLDLENISKVLLYIRNLQESVSDDLLYLQENTKISLEQNNHIQSLLTESLEFNNKYYNSLNIDEFNNSILFTYYSLWNIQSASVLIEIYPTQNQINESLTILNVNNNFYHYLPYDKLLVARELSSDNRRFLTFISDLDDIPDELKYLKSEIKTYNNFKSSIYEIKYISRNFHEYVLADFEYQNWLLKIKLLFSIIIILFVFWLGRISKSNLFNKKSYNFINDSNFSETFFPEFVKIDTVKQILKLDSVIIVLTALGTFFSSIFKNNGLSNILIFFIIVSVISTLTSISVALVSLNNDSEKARKTSYYLFQIALISFILIIIYVFLLFGFASIVELTKDSINEFFINSTIKQF